MINELLNKEEFQNWWLDNKQKYANDVRMLYDYFDSKGIYCYLVLEYDYTWVYCITVFDKKEITGEVDSYSRKQAELIMFKRAAKL